MSCMRIMHAACMSLALLPGSGPVMYGGQQIQVLHASVTVSRAFVHPTHAAHDRCLCGTDCCCGGLATTCLKTAFLNAVLEEEVYVHPPAGFEHLAGSPGQVLRLRRVMYGSRQAPRASRPN